MTAYGRPNSQEARAREKQTQSGERDPFARRAPFQIPAQTG